MNGLVVIAILLLVQLALTGLARRRLRGRRFSLRAAGVVTGALGLSGAVLWAIYMRSDLTLEREPSLLWAFTCAASALVGCGGAAVLKRMPTWELFVGCLLVLDAAAVLAVLGPGDHGLTSAPLRALLIAPAALAACSYFGASIGFLFLTGGTQSMRLGYEAMIGRRFLLSKSSRAVSIVTAISIIGVAVGVMAVIGALAVLSGFEGDLRTKIIGANAHASIEGADGRPLQLTPTLVDEIANTRGVVAASPYVQGEVAVANPGANYTGTAIMVGIDPYRAPDVLTVLNQITRGSLDGLKPQLDAGKPAAEEGEFAPPAKVPGIVIGIEMANSLQLKIGDKVRVLSPLLEVLTPVGVAPKSVSLQVVGVFSSKMYEYDAHLTFISIEEARRFYELGANDATGIQLLTEDPERSDLIGNAALASAKSAQNPLTLVDWKVRNQSLFAALKLERVVAFIVLVFIILVASFSIVNTLTMSVIEKKKEIAILKTMGAHDAGIMKIFITQGLLVGGFGIVVGVALALGLVSVLRKLWLPNDVYYIDALPVHLEVSDVVLVALSALLIVWNFAVFPALRGSALTPVEGLRDG